MNVPIRQAWIKHHQKCKEFTLSLLIWLLTQRKSYFRHCWWIFHLCLEIPSFCFHMIAVFSISLRICSSLSFSRTDLQPIVHNFHKSSRPQKAESRIICYSKISCVKPVFSLDQIPYEYMLNFPHSTHLHHCNLYFPCSLSLVLP